MKLVSIVVPCYNEEEALPFLYEALEKETAEITDHEFEYVFVNDGSKDRTLELLKQYSKENPKVKYVSFSRNFGKESAILAGFKNSSGDLVTMMDADMQDPPSLLSKMIDIIEKDGYDSVATRRVTRKGEPKLRSYFARKFYKIINKISDADIVDGARDYRMMKREMVEVIINMCETNRFSKGIFGWIGFRTYWLPYENVQRVAGKTKWNFIKLFKYAVNGIADFSVSPLSVSFIFGAVSFLTSLGLFIAAIVRKVAYGYSMQSFISICALICFLFSILFALIGVSNLYLGKTYKETQSRPHYIVGDTNIEEAKRIG